MDAKTLTEQISQSIDVPVPEVKKMLASLCDIIARDCGAGDSIVVPAFGTFESRKRLERVSVHPSTGKRMLVPPKVLLTFKPSAVLKNRVKEP